MAHFLNPSHHLWRVIALLRNNDNIGLRSILEGVIGDDLHAPGGADWFRGLRDSVEVERMQLFVGLILGMEHNIAEDLPRTGEVDHHGAIGDGDSYLNLAGGGRREFR